MNWVEEVLQKIKETLDSEVIPEPAKDCDYCSYRKASRDVLLAKQKNETKNGGEQQSLL